MQFLYSPLTWGFFLIGVPVLIHLINLLRHRRIKWAAMDFLLESYRRNRRWVILKQWLLLLSRMLAMGLLVMLLAKWVSSSQWLSWLGGKTTHHFILLDDSYSMSARQTQNSSAYDLAMRALSGLTQEIANQPGDHQITLIRWSRAVLAMRQAAKDADQAEASADSAQSPVGRIDLAADLLAQSVSTDSSRLLERINATQPTSLAISPEPVLDLIAPALTGQTGELPVVYLLTDLRRNQFGEPEALKANLQRLSQLNVPLHLIDCSEGEAQNLSVASLVPEQEVWAAGVPLLVRFSVRNQSGQTAKNVVAKLRVVLYSDGEVSPSVDAEYSGQVMELPPVVIESIDPGQTISRQAQVVFAAPGNHAIEVTIPDDSLATDNARWSTVDIRQSQRILLVDGDVKQTNAFYFQSVMQPGETLQTGLAVEKVDVSYLRDVAPEELASFDVVGLLDLPRMDPQAAEKLKDYAESGGGILMVCGGNTNLSFANEQLYQAGTGIMPVELQEVDQLPEVIGAGEPQVIALDHPVLAPLQKLTTSPFFALRIRKRIVPTEASLTAPGLQVVALGPDRRPLIVDKQLGAGRVLAVLTGLSSDWSNWAQDPTFVVIGLRSMGYLGSFRRAPTEQPVGSDLNMIVTRRAVLSQGDILLPSAGSRRVRLQRQVSLSEDDQVAKLSLAADLEADSSDRIVLEGLLRQGLFESWLTSSDGTAIVHNVAHNVAPEEGNLERISHQEIERQFPGVDLHIRNSSTVASGLNARESSQSNLLIALLVLLLIGEQMLAYSASYHASAPTRQFGISQREGGGK
jgi:Aerotolerance regulator N-terminal